MITYFYNNEEVTKEVFYEWLDVNIEELETSNDDLLTTVLHHEMILNIGDNNFVICVDLPRLTRQKYTQEIYQALRSDETFKHSLGIKWLEHMSDYELLLKYGEVK